MTASTPRPVDRAAPARHPTRRRRLTAGAIGVAVVALAACGGGQPTRTAATSPTTSTSTTTSPTTSRTTTTPPTTTTSRATARATTSKPRPRATARATTHAQAVPRSTTSRSTTPRAATCRVPAGVTATQVVVVKGSGSTATVRACRRSGGGYLLALGPYYGHVGINGVTWSKREGDLKTPAGTFPLRGGFGVRSNPGLQLGWFVVDGNDVWVDDSASRLYNTHQRKPAAGRWTSAENLYNTPVYSYAQVIGYNEARTPGRGSAIFFHVDKGSGTAGCVSLPTGALLSIFRWERPGAVMSIS